MFCERAKPRGAGCENFERRREIICSHKLYKKPIGFSFLMFVETAAMPRKRAGPRGAGCENFERRREIICSHKLRNVCEIINHEVARKKSPQSLRDCGIIFVFLLIRRQKFALISIDEFGRTGRILRHIVPD